MCNSILRSSALALVMALAPPIAVRAETISEPPAASADPAASLPPPTVLRGSPLSTSKTPAICPPGYAISPGYGCVGPSSSDSVDYGQGYDYWPYGWGYPVGGVAGFGHGAGRLHRFSKSHGFSHFRGSAHFRGPAKFGGFGTETGHMAGFGRR